MQDIRIERKYTEETLGLAMDLVTWLGQYNLLEHYPQRQVNSLYFDTPDLKFYHQTVNGDYERIKPRIRWYGDLEGKELTAQLELKKKWGEVGSKEVLGLQRFSYIEGGKKKSLEKFVGAKGKKNKDEKIESLGRVTSLIGLDLVSNLIPIVTTVYKRSYFISFDHTVRLTIDSNLETYNHIDQISFSAQVSRYPFTIIELKYHPDEEDKARELANRLPMNLSRFSKYEIGVINF